MSQEAITSPLTELHNWYSRLPDGGYLLTDPLNGQHLSFAIVPSWLEEEPDYKAGLEFLQAARAAVPFEERPGVPGAEVPYIHMRGSNVHITAIYGRHMYAGDLGSIDKAWFEQRVASSDYFGIEYRSHTAGGMEDFLKIARQALADTMSPGDNFDEYVLNHDSAWAAQHGHSHLFRSFLARIGRAAVMLGTPVFSHDVRSESPAAVENDYLRALQKLKESEPFEEEGAVAAALINAREWIQAANIGRHLAREKGIRPDRLLEMLITDGDVHRDVSRKLRLLGAEVTAISMCRLLPNYMSVDFDDVFRQGRLTELQAKRFEYMLFRDRLNIIKILDEWRADPGNRPKKSRGIPGPRKKHSNEEAAGFMD